MAMIVDEQKLHTIIARPEPLPEPGTLSRAGKVFFVGGNLPVHETLETMFESFSMESTDLFHLSFGTHDDFFRGEEMARQIKKNFNVRLMGKIPYPAPAHTIERAYAAGVDMLDISAADMDSASPDERRSVRQDFRDSLAAAVRLLPRWSTASTLVLGAEPPATVMNDIDILLNAGVVPLVTLTTSASPYRSGDVAAVFAHLGSGWERHHATMKPFLPLISLTTPLVLAEKAGRLQSVINRIHDRHLLATSDLRRHLRVVPAKDSLDSAGL
ncbi:MAG: hypothetical protein CXR31_01330 [Geobacter sp.]|nr:MAG: hypothetical protein CXR31_01330 [Geobacter sp.]